MKKLFITSIMLVSFTCSFAQLKVNNNGSINLFQSSQNNVQNKVTIGNPQASTVYDYAYLSVKAKAQSIGRTVAIIGDATDASYGSVTPNVGVWGITGGTASAYNCGLAGTVGSSYGVGVYGSSNASLVYIGYGTYAGYFNGTTHVAGNITATQFLTSSDRSLKENIHTFGDANSGDCTLEKVMDMNVVSYNYKRQPEESKDGDSPMLRRLGEDGQKLHFGLIAQELQELYPNLVEEGQDGYLSVNYIELVPVLIKAIQEQQEEIDALKGGGTVRKAHSTSGIDHEQAPNVNRLYQNTPNPFKEQTLIRFTLADDAADAAVCIFDMTGKQLRRFPVTPGMDSITISGGDLGAGMFLYSLIVDGQEIDTKRMILSK